MTVAAAERQEIEALLYREARLLDERRFREWLELFTKDAVYWLPAGGESPDPLKHVSLVYDDVQRLDLRIGRLQSANAWAQDPPSSTVRSVTGIEVGAPQGSEVDVDSVLTVLELRASRQHLYMARCRHRLRRDDGWRIVRKEVRLLNRGEVIDNLTILF